MRPGHRQYHISIRNQADSVTTRGWMAEAAPLLSRLKGFSVARRRKAGGSSPTGRADATLLELGPALDDVPRDAER